MTDTMIAPPAVMERLPEFFELVIQGVGPKNAAVACGWTIRQLHELEAMPQFQEAMSVACERRLESVEQVAYELAGKGNVPMIQMILYCQGADRGWRPPTQRVSVLHGGSVAVERVSAVREAARAIMKEHGSAALAIGGPLDDDEDIEDADVIDP